MTAEQHPAHMAEFIAAIKAYCSDPDIERAIDELRAVAAGLPRARQPKETTHA